MVSFENLVKDLEAKDVVAKNGPGVAKSV